MRQPQSTLHTICINTSWYYPILRESGMYCFFTGASPPQILPLQCSVCVDAQTMVNPTPVVTSPNS